MLNNDKMWTAVFNSNDTAWLDALEKEKNLSEDEVMEVLGDMTNEIKSGEIIGMYIQDYNNFKGFYECEFACDYFSPAIVPNYLTLEIVADNGRDFCNIDPDAIDKLVFKRLGRNNILGFYEIHLYSCGYCTKIEFVVRYDAVAEGEGNKAIT